ncbi:MAG: hypothetical protein PHN57_07215 [Candidatus Omnitrophica bacterium]|nr:hypothetical protein [Candidatus Omnitrophota bacterium]
MEEAIASYTAPLVIDKEKHRYLSAKKENEEKARREEERKKEEERIELDARERKQRIEEKQRLEDERREFEHGPVKIIFDSGRIRIYYNGKEMTSELGLHSIFTGEDGLEYSSNSAARRVRKLSGTERVCFFKWHNGLKLFQVWKIKIAGGVIDLEITMQQRDNRFTRNERVELALISCGEALPHGSNGWNNKARKLALPGEHPVAFHSTNPEQVSGINKNTGKGVALYFLSVPGRKHYALSGKKLRYTYFQGSIDLNAQNFSPDVNPSSKSCLKSGDLNLLFENGSLQLLWKDKPVTKGLGAYTSICSRGVWYDSSQAIWEIKQAGTGRIVAEGFWPWLTVSQRWELNLKEGNCFSWDIEMEVYRKTRLDIEEAVIMLSEEYKDWFAGNKTGAFAEEFISNDLFRYCIWNGRADGKTSVGVKASHLPRVEFSSEPREETGLMIENSAHIYNTKSRLLHCIKIKGEGEKDHEPGKFSFFKGSITVREEAE